MGGKGRGGSNLLELVAEARLDLEIVLSLMPDFGEEFLTHRSETGSVFYRTRARG